MKKPFWCLLLALTTSAQALELAPLQQQPQTLIMSSALLSRFHYKPARLDDALSEKIFEQYLKALDGEKYFFDQRDIDQLATLRTRLDDSIRAQNLNPAFGIFNLYTQRVVERFGYARELLKTGFDFNVQESMQLSRQKANWAQSDEEVANLWRKRVKNDWLRLKLAGKNPKAIVETLDKRYEASIRRVGRLKSEDAFQTFMNAYTTAIEPHTNYLGPRASENFDISMRLSLVGIGAVLEEKEEYTSIRELMAGGPAARSGLLKPGDRIVGVGQGDNGPMIDVVGWRLDETVRLIRGEADTTVVLDILPANSEKHRQIKLTRKKISLEEQAAKKSVIQVSDNGVTRQIGVIALPSFYQDFEARQKGDPNFRSATRDVERILGELKKQKVDSILIDLRDNGGGSLVEAIELTGLFIDQGPVVLQRDAEGKITQSHDTNAGTAWDGRLGVLINRNSASASEIFAAAIQDYGRGLIIGEPSFGKGTVQTLLDMDRIARSDKAVFGELKLTIAQFFRINGGTTQLRGVVPDIAFPTDSDDDNQRESAFENALPWTQIPAAEFAPAGDIRTALPTLNERHKNRLLKNKEFQSLQAEIQEGNRLRQSNQISLNEAVRRQERDAQDARLTSRDGKAGVLQDDGLQAEERQLANDQAKKKERDKARDVLLTEAAAILGDEVGLLKAPPRLAANEKKPSRSKAGAAPESTLKQ